METEPDPIPSKRRPSATFQIALLIPWTRSHTSTVKTQIEEESEVSINAKPDKKGVSKQEEPETTTVTAKGSKKRKTKEEKELEAMPLRARTQGLRMFIGAHVSAAKGELLLYFISWISLRRANYHPGVFNAVNNSMHIGYCSLIDQPT